uniref:Uncharacterized protein n=1 Tax=Manihot esculenta TaxID=3983 RepID=A0A2C9VCV2_MANES
MGIPKLLLSHLRRSRAVSSLNSLSRAYVSHFLINPTPLLSQAPIPSHNPRGPHYANAFTSFHLFNNRSFSTRSDDDLEFFADSVTMSGVESKPPEFAVNEVAEAVVKGSTGGEESILPVRALISLLDGFHDLTGLPWWIVIISATVSMRVLLFPLLVLQLNKLKRISELLPKFSMTLVGEDSLVVVL